MNKQRILKVAKWAVIPTVLAIILIVAIFVVEYKADSPINPSTSCTIQRGKPLLLVLVNGKNASTICNNAIANSHGSYFVYYGDPPKQFYVACAIAIHGATYIVYDFQPMNGYRYSEATFCPYLQTHHWIPGVAHVATN